MTTQRKPPSHLGKAGRALWADLSGDYEIVDADGWALLEVACVCADRLQQARETIAKEGCFATDRYGSAKAHPALLLEKDARNGLIQSIKALDLSDDAQNVMPKFLGRPPGLRSAN